MSDDMWPYLVDFMFRDAFNMIFMFSLSVYEMQYVCDTDGRNADYNKGRF